MEASIKDFNINISTVLDSCSQSSFIESDLADRIGLKVVSSDINLVIKDMNSKSVILPFKMGSNSYEIVCICIPKIKIEMKVCNISRLSDLI